MVYKIRVLKLLKIKSSVHEKYTTLHAVLSGIFYLNLAVAQDDVYDAPEQKPMKVKTYKQQHNITSDERLGNPEQTQSYSEGDNSNTV